MVVAQVWITGIGMAWSDLISEPFRCLDLVVLFGFGRMVVESGCEA